MCVCGLRKPNLQIINLKLEMFWEKGVLVKNVHFYTLTTIHLNQDIKCF